jgi:hypothetical protein
MALTLAVENELRHEIAEFFKKTSTKELSTMLALLIHSYLSNSPNEKEDDANITSLVFELQATLFNLQIIINKSYTQKAVLIDGNKPPCTRN